MTDSGKFRSCTFNFNAVCGTMMSDSEGRAAISSAPTRERRPAQEISVMKGAEAESTKDSES